MAISVGVGPATATALATTLTRVNTASSVQSFDVSCDADLYLVYSDALDDGGALPAAYLRIPANVVYTVLPLGPRILLAAASGTPTVTLIGLPV